MDNRCQSFIDRCLRLRSRVRGYLVACLLLLGLGAMAAFVGCARPYYRDKADKEVSEVIREKDHYPAWKVEQFHVYPDPRARFADQGNPDFPPMPPDDPAAADEAPTPQRPKKAGIALMEGGGYLDLLTAWDAENRAREAEKQKQATQSTTAGGFASSPQSSGASATPGQYPGAGSDTFPDPFASKTPRRGFLLNIDQAVELGLVNSREFQDRREDLYLQALPVTAERFAFSSQFFAVGEVLRERLGRRSPGGPANRWVGNSSLGFSKLFSTGALLLFRFANRTAIELANPRTKHTISESTLNLDLVQPLLRGGGRAVTLEPLTFAERNLLYEIRDYARFRKQFYVGIAGGGDIGAITVGATRFRNRATSFFPGIGALGAALIPGRGGVPGLQVSGSARPSGFLPTLQSAAILENEQNNVASLEGFLRLFQAFEEGGDVSQLQVYRVEQQLLQSRNAVFQRNQDLRDALDALKLQLGVPVNLPLELDDEPVEPLRQQLRAFRQVIDQFDETRLRAGELILIPQAAALRERLRQLATEAPLVRTTRFRTEFPRRWAAWARRSPQELRARLAQFREELRRLLASRDELANKGQPVPETLARRIDEVRDEINLGEFEQALRLYEAQPLARGGAAFIAGPGLPAVMPLAALLAPVPPASRGQLSYYFRRVVNLFEVILLNARNERLAEVQARWPGVPRACVKGLDLLTADLDVAESAVAQVALTSRFDLMNARAILVDAWRQIRLAANDLLGAFNVEYHLTSLTPPNLAQPLAFSGSRTRHQLSLNGELPLVRLLERNAYRASLIGWQRQRRFLMATEDTIVAGVRSQLRQLRVLATNYKIQQRAVEVAYLQVENALDTFRAPPSPPGAGAVQPPGGGGGRGGDPAALTQQLLEAQSNLNRTQSTLITLWVQYLTTRMQLYRDLELMPFDNRGVWIDDIATCECPPDGSSGERPGEQQSASRSKKGD